MKSTKKHFKVNRKVVIILINTNRSQAQIFKIFSKSVWQKNFNVNKPFCLNLNANFDNVQKPDKCFVFVKLISDRTEPTYVKKIQIHSLERVFNLMLDCRNGNGIE